MSIFYVGYECKCRKNCKEPSLNENCAKYLYGDFAEGQRRLEDGFLLRINEISENLKQKFIEGTFECRSGVVLIPMGKLF
jgi:hypothetical protein